MATQTTEHVELPITGMTCASCANRIERKLNKLDGVSASVNYATERASVEYEPGAVAPEQLVAAVEAAGYQAVLPSTQPEAPAEADETAPLRQRLLISLALMLPVLALAMIPPLQFDYWQWLSLTLAAPVVVWGAWPFHRAAWANLRHATATMDTLISVGVLAAFAWSLYALFIGDAGMPGMTMGFDLVPERGAERAARARRQGRRRPGRRRRRAARAGRAARGRRPLRGAPGREGRHGRRRRARDVGGRRVAADRRVR